MSSNRKNSSPDTSVESADGRTQLKGIAQIIAEDLDRRNRLERSLLRSRRRYKLLVESVNDWVWEVDAAGRYIYVGPQVKQILSYEPEQMIGKTPFDFMPPEEARRVSRLFRDHLKKGAPLIAIDNINLNKDGVRVYLETSGTPVYDDQNRVVGYRGIDRDVTARRKAEEILLNAKQALEREVKNRTLKLRQANLRLVEKISANEELTRQLGHSNERYRMLLQASPEPVVVYDTKGVTTLVNTAFVQKFGWSEQECLGKSIHPVSEIERKWLPSLRKRVPAGRQAQFVETRLATKDGQTLDCQVSHALVVGPDGKPTENILIIRDISQLKEKEAQLKEQSRHLEEVNTTLRVLLEQGNREREEIEERILTNVRNLIQPYFEKVRRGSLNPYQRHYLDLLEANLATIVSPFSNSLSRRYAGLSATEIKVADMVRQGRKSHEISSLLGISAKTVAVHRGNIRRKLGLRKSRENLRTYLLSLS